MRTVIRKRYSSDFKAQAVELVNLGRSVPEVAEELGIGTSILYRWALAATPPTQLLGAAQRAGGEMSEAEELRRLRKQNAHLLMENDILKKAAIILGTPPPSRPGR
jgi:transposase